MRKNLGVKHYLNPCPVLIIATYNEDGSVDAMNAAWGCVADHNKIALVLGQNHKTSANILRTKSLSISLATKSYVKEADYVGLVSANDHVKKMDVVNWHYSKSTFVEAPIIEELPICLECSMESYDLESEIMLCEIKNCSVGEAYLKDGKIDVSKMELICFDGINHDYYIMQEKVGKAFFDGLSLKENKED